MSGDSLEHWACNSCLQSFERRVYWAAMRRETPRCPTCGSYDVHWEGARPAVEP